MSEKDLVPQLWPKFLSTSQIAVFIDNQHIWKESVDTYDFLHEYNHQGKVGPENATSG